MSRKEDYFGHNMASWSWEGEMEQFCWLLNSYLCRAVPGLNPDFKIL